MERIMDLTMEIEKYKGQGANILMPSTMIGGLSEFHQPVIEAVQLSANPSDGDVYQDTISKKFRLTKQALMKLGNCAGISWHPYETKRVDNRTDRDYVAYQAVGGIRKADGSSIAFKAEYDMDFEVILEELTAQYTAKAQKGTEDAKRKYIEDSVKREMLFKRKHKVKLCEAGAMNRVIRSLLGLKNGYSEAELKQPFVTVRIVIRPDYGDKEVRRQMMTAAVKSMTGIYGNDASMASNGSTECIPNGDDFNNQVIDIPHDDEGYIPPGDYAPGTGPEPELELAGSKPNTTEAEKAEPKASGGNGTGKSVQEQEIDFSNQDHEGQVQTIETLIKRKAYDTKVFPCPLAEFKAATLARLFKALIALPDASPPATNGAPGSDVDF